MHDIWYVTLHQLFMDQRLINTALIALAKTPNAVLNKGGENRYPDFSGNVLSFYLLSIILVISWPFIACILI